MGWTYKDWAMVQGAMGDLAPAIEKMKRDRMAKQLLGEPLEEYQLKRMQTENRLNDQLKAAQIAKALREPQGRTIDEEMRDLKILDLQERINERKARDQVSPKDMLKLELDERKANMMERRYFPEDFAQEQKIPALEAEIAKLQGDVTSGNEYWGPESWRFGKPSSAKLKAKQTELEQARVLSQRPSAIEMFKQRMAADGTVAPTTPSQAPAMAPPIPPDKTAEAAAIRAAFKAGTITREEAKAKLQALTAR